MSRRSHPVRVRGAATGFFPIAALLLVVAACGNNSGPDPAELIGIWDYRLAYRDSVTLDTLVVVGTVTIEQAGDTAFGGTFRLGSASPRALAVDPIAPVTGVVTNGLVEFDITGLLATVQHRGDYDSSVMFGVAQATPAVADTLLFTMWWSSENRP
jgi:hypothetical protein